MTYDLPWLLEQVEAGKTLKYLYFWGHRPSPDGNITSTCFSQWWEGHPFEEDGKTYLTAEHYMMAGKARLFGDSEMEANILASASPGEAKKFGREVRGFSQQVWEENCCEIVTQGSYLKFSQHPELQAYLLGTGPRILVEASPVDAIWGIGMAANDKGVHHPANWKGTNLLGFCLMEARDRLGGTHNASLTESKQVGWSAWYSAPTENIYMQNRDEPRFIPVSVKEPVN